jgi:hypothetical protein
MYCETKDKSTSNPIFLRDKKVLLPMYPLPMPLKYYASFILPPKIRDSISWGNITEKEFSLFLKENQLQFFYIY